MTPTPKDPEISEKVQQFNIIDAKYSHFVTEDPMRNFLHYPTVIKLLGDIKGKNILDVGCGDGLFDRILVQKTGAIVHGYDKAPNLISIAKELEKESPLNIEYSVSDPQTFSSNTKFENAVTVMVLCYAPDEKYLGYFFDSTKKTLSGGGRFISVTFNPSFVDFGKQIGNRIFNKLPNGEIEVSFLNPENKSVMFKSHLNQFSKEVYEGKAREAGFKEVAWKDLAPSEDGISKLGKEFWGNIEKQQPYNVFIAS